MLLLGNMCNRVDQASKFFFKEVVVQNNNSVRYASFKVLRLGYILFSTTLNFKYIKVGLKYLDSESAIRGFFMVSKFSSMINVKSKNIIKLSIDNFYAMCGFLFFYSDRYGMCLDIECFLSGSGGKLAFGVY